jgi:hypothetical protein
VIFKFNTVFDNFIYDNQKRIIGANVKQDNNILSISARLVVDASGMSAVARTKLSNDCKVENFTLSPRDMFYVTLRYVTLKNPQDQIKYTTT